MPMHRANSSNNHQRQPARHHPPQLDWWEDRWFHRNVQRNRRRNHLASLSRRRNRNP